MDTTSTVVAQWEGRIESRLRGDRSSMEESLGRYGVR
jgi:hypothetical protein